MQSTSRLYQDQQRGSRRNSFQDTTNGAKKDREGKPVGDKQDKDGKGKDAGERIAEEKRRIRKEIIVKVNQERTERLKMKTAIFGEKWLDRCHEQVIYPNEACAELMERVGRALARRISSPQDSEQKQQALFYLLGPEYTEQHFPTYTYSVDILEPPKMQPARKEKYLEEMTDFLRTALEKAMKDCQFPASYSQYAVDDELFRFLQQARAVYRDGLERQVAKKTQQMGGEGDNRTAFIDNDAPYDDSQQQQLTELKRLVTVGGVQTDIAGRAIVAILRRDPSKKKDFLKSLTTKKIPLPSGLRRYVWTECLQAKQRGSTPATRAGKTQAEAPVLGDPWQQQLKEFNEGLVKQVKVQKLPRATRSRNSAAIDAAVIEAYDTNAVLKDMDSDDHNMSTARVLNAFDVYTQKFSPTHVYWLLPLQCVYVKDTNEEEGAHTLRLAFILAQVVTTLCPKQDAIFSMADRVMATFREQDNLYYSRLTSSMSQQTSKIDTKSFPPEVLDRNPATAAKFHAALRDGGTGDLTETDLQVLTDPAIFVRKWIAQGFVGVLSLGASLWAWDQLMLCGWSQDFTVQLCVAVLSLVRPWMMRANKYSGAKKVLLQEPAKIYTSDLLKVLKHLQTEGRLGEAPPTTNYIGPPSIQVLDEYGHQTKARQDNPRNTKAPKDADEAMERERDIEPRTRGRGSVSVLPYKPTSDFDLSMSGIAFSEADDEYEPLPTPEPKPDSDTEPEDEAAAKGQPQKEEELSPLPPPKPPPTKAQTWLPHDRTTRSTLPKPCRISDAVDLYIDEVRFLPDCVDVCKVTGRIYNHNLEEDAPPPPAILAYPVLTASQKCPTFGYRAVINEDRGFLNPDLVVMLTIYGYQTSIRTVAPVGSCLISLFDSQLADPLLRVGAYQFRIRNGRPAPEGGVSNLKMTDMDQKKPIPALTVLVRILPHSKDMIPMPPYEEGYYRGNNCEPTPTERELMHHYRYHPEYETRTVQDRLQFMMQVEGLETTDRRAIEDYMKKKLTMKVARKNVLPPATDFTYFTDYYTAKGMKVDIQGAYHLPDYMEDYYILAFAEVMDGDTATAEREKDEAEKNALIQEKKAKGLDYKFIIDHYPLDEQRMMTSRLDMKSSRQSPQWLDENVTTLHPIMGSQSVLLVRLFGLKLAYTPSNDGLKPGTIKALDDGKLSYKTPLCWGVVQIFAKGTAMGGTHFVPLFEGGPSVMMVAMLRKDPPAKALDAALKKNLIKVLPGASLDVRLWDAKITDYIELPQSTHRHLAQAVNADEKIMKGREATFDKKYDEFVLKGMKQADRFDLHKVLIESEFFRQAANIKFGNELNAALKQAGKEPMPPLPVFAG